MQGPRASLADELELEPGALCVGNGAVRYRATLERLGAVVPPDEDDVHLPHARLHAALAADFGPVEEIEPVYVRLPDARGGDCVNVELRRLERTHLDAVEAIERESYPTPWSRSMFDAELRKPSSLAIGAFTEDGDLVGYAFVSRYVDAWHVMNVAVATAFRRRGIASALLERTFALTTSDPRRGYTLEVRVSNAGAIRLYERLGFEPRGIRRGYYTDNREDALIMWREPSSSEQAS